MPTTRLIAFASTFVLLLGTGTSALAFIDSSGLTDSLKKVEQEFSGDDTGLSGLIDELDEAAGENADAYLSIRDSSGKSVTIWDVGKSAWFYSYVLALSELGIVSGYKDASGNLTGSYKPGNNVTRAEALKIALGAAGVNPDSCSGSPANRTAAGHWAERYVVCAEQRDLGLGASTDINGPAGRAEVLHYTLKAFGIDAPDGSPPFGDSATHKYKNDIAYAYALEIVSGDKNADGSEKGTFRPNDSVNRAEVAKIVKLAIELL